MLIKQLNINSNLTIEINYLSKIANFTISKEAKANFTFENLRTMCCEYWNIPESNFKDFFIKTNKEIFHHEDIVFLIVKNATENSFKHNFELIDKKYILENKTKIMEYFANNNNKDEFEDIDLIEKGTKKASGEIRFYANDFDELEREESVWELFKEFWFGNKELNKKVKDEEGNFEVDFRNLIEKRRAKEKVDQIDESEEERIQKEKDELEEKKQIGEERKKILIQKFYKRRKLKPLIITPYDIFVFRVKCFISLIFYIYFLYSIFNEARTGNTDILFLGSCYNRIKDLIFLNGNFKYFVHKRNLLYIQPDEINCDFRDMTNYLIFVMNNVIVRDSDSYLFKLGKYTPNEMNNFFMIQSVRFTFKYTMFLKDDTSGKLISQKFYDLDYPLTPEYFYMNEKNSYQKVNASYLLDNKNLSLLDYKNKIFYNFTKSGQDERLYFRPYSNPYINKGQIRNYRTQGFDFYINFNYISRKDYDLLVSQMIKDLMLLDNVSFMKMSINFYHPVFNVYLKIDFMIEFTALGYFYTNLETNIMDVALSRVFYKNPISYFNFYCIFFMISHISKFIFFNYMEKKDTDDPDIIDRSAFIWDSICFLTLLISLTYKILTISMYIFLKLNIFKTHLSN